MWSSLRTAAPDSGVVCPRCQAATLVIHLSCLSTRFTCPRCHHSFTLDEITRFLGTEEFERIEQILGERSSDRL